MVSYEYDIASLMDSWSDWCSKLIELSKLEYSSRSFIKRILDQLNETNTDDNSMFIVKIYVIIFLACILLII